MAKSNIKSTIKDLLAKQSEYKLLLERKAELESELSEYGLLTVSTSKPTKTKSTKPRVARAELTDESLLKFCGKGKKTGEIVSHFAGGAKVVIKAIKKLVTDDKLGKAVVKGKGKPAIVYSAK